MNSLLKNTVPVVSNVSNAIARQVPAAAALVSLLVDGRPVQVEKGNTLLEAINKSGSHVPTLCFHPEFKPR